MNLSEYSDRRLFVTSETESEKKNDPLPAELLSANDISFELTPTRIDELRAILLEYLENGAVDL